MTVSTAEVLHTWTKERKALPVELITKRAVYVRWGMAGVYEICLKTGVMRPRDDAAKRKKQPCLWKAADIEALRHMVNTHFAGVDEKKEVRARMATHSASMSHSERQYTHMERREMEEDG